MKNRLSEIMPDLEARAEAIDMLPKLLKSYNKEISEVKRAVATSVGAVVGFAIGGFLGGAIGSAISGKISGNLSRKIKQNAINKIISKQTPEKIATIQEIQKKLESKKTLSEEEKAVLDEVRKIVQQAKKEVLALPETPETPPPTVI
ncbi:MAG: hypothetical protein LBG59_07485 [Candidatus Peribacteria bacterium]|jgi:DNA repair exonuclease SbcCD ATPase subunit|nr:hypothetical protein [Candidatus Peribacteria bacterium]